MRRLSRWAVLSLGYKRSQKKRKIGPPKVFFFLNHFFEGRNIGRESRIYFSRTSCTNLCVSHMPIAGGKSPVYVTSAQDT